MTAIRGGLVGALVLLVFMMGCKKNEGGTGPGGGGGTITVNGYVQDSYLNPVSGAVVIISGKTPVTSAANGSFTVSDVSTPYDITVVVGAQKRAVVYQGLTRTDPALLAIGIPLPTAKNATISGTVPGAPSATTVVLFASGVKRWSTFADATTGAYTISATWYDTNTVYAGQLYVLRWTPNSGLPTAYDGYGNRALTITAGGTFNSGNDFTAGQLTDPPEQTISGSVVRPTGFNTVNYRQFYIYFGNALLSIAGESGTLADAFSYTVPNIPGTTFAIYAVADANNRETSYLKTGIAGGASGVNVTLELAPQLSSPVNNATNIDTSISFLWTQGGGTGVNRVYIYDGAANPRFYIFTTANTVRIPNLAAQGLGLPSNFAYTWYVLRYYPISSVDNLASANYPQFGIGGDIGYLYSEGWAFTTKP